MHLNEQNALSSRQNSTWPKSPISVGHPQVTKLTRRRQGVISGGGGGGAEDAWGRRGRLRSAAPREARLHHGRRGWGRRGDGWRRHEGGVLQQMMQPAPDRSGAAGGGREGSAGRVHVPADESPLGSTTPKARHPIYRHARSFLQKARPRAHLLF